MKSALPEGFSIPDFAVPLDVTMHIARVPSAAAVKGTIIQSTLDALKAAGEARPQKSYLPFRDYPMRELLELNIESAHRLFPGAPVREGLRRLGRGVFPAFAQTLVGRVMYGVFGSSVGSILKLANRSFEVTQNMGKVTTIVVGRTARLRFVDTYTFLSSYHFGILEGTLDALQVNGRVSFKPNSETEGEFCVEWEDRAIVAAEHSA